jgi:hypothetical protein
MFKDRFLDFWQEEMFFSFFKTTHAGSGTHTVSYSMGTGAPFWGIKRPGPESDH